MGKWLLISIIDSRADQILTGFSTSGVQVGYAVTQAIGSVSPGVGSTTVLDGYLKGVITGIGVSTVDVKLISHVTDAGVETNVDYQRLGFSILLIMVQ